MGEACAKGLRGERSGQLQEGEVGQRGEGVRGAAGGLRGH